MADQRGTAVARNSMEHRAGIEPANTGFADQRVSHFATGALVPPRPGDAAEFNLLPNGYFGAAAVRR